jgi:hypothetical protein
VVLQVQIQQHIARCTERIARTVLVNDEWYNIIAPRIPRKCRHIDSGVLYTIRPWRPTADDCFVSPGYGLIRCGWPCGAGTPTMR